MGWDRCLEKRWPHISYVKIFFTFKGWAGFGGACPIPNMGFLFLQNNGLIQLLVVDFYVGAAIPNRKPVNKTARALAVAVGFLILCSIVFHYA